MKLDDYEFKGISRELDDFKDDLRLIINFGKVPLQVVNTVPDWTARNGETVLYSDGTDQRWYFYLANEWKRVSLTGQWVGAWCIFSATNGVVTYDSFNVASITRNATRDYTLTWSRPFLTNNYVLTGSQLDNNGGVVWTTTDGFVIDVNLLEGENIPDVLNTKSARISFYSFTGNNETPNNDASLLNVMAVGNL